MAEERGGEIVVRRRRGGGGSPFEVAEGEPEEHPARAGRSGRRPSLHHSLSLYGTPLGESHAGRRRPCTTSRRCSGPMSICARVCATGCSTERCAGRPPWCARRAQPVTTSSSISSAIPTACTWFPRGWTSASGPHHRPTPTNDEPYLLYVGGLVEHDPRKKVEELIDAFAEWSLSEGREETLILAGAMGKAGKEFEKRARDAGARTVFTGFVAERDLPALYSGASCFVTAGVRGASACRLWRQSPAARRSWPTTPARSPPRPARARCSFRRATARPSCAPPGASVTTPRWRAASAEEGRRHAAGFSWRRTAELTWDVYAGCLTPD